jgi:hypothetical protein
VTGTPGTVVAGPGTVANEVTVMVWFGTVTGTPETVVTGPETVDTAVTVTVLLPPGPPNVVDELDNGGLATVLVMTDVTVTAGKVTAGPSTVAVATVVIV